MFRPRNKKVIHIFNPETDYALAAGRNVYNPPASILKFKIDNALRPVSFADSGDIVIIPREDVSSLNNSLLKEADMRGISLFSLRRLCDTYSHEELECRYVIHPWGWNHSLRHQLLSFGIPPSMMKSADDIDNLIFLAHRRTAIDFQKIMTGLIPDVGVAIAEEIQTVDDGIAFLNKYGDAYFKAPWSSSGRGVIHAADLSAEKITQWVGGCIRRQGCVIAERAFARLADFATEWWVEDGVAYFVGLSFFTTSPSGRYLGNLLMPQEQIEQKIVSLSSQWSREIINSQKMALESIVGNKYSGPVGIDMLIDKTGYINPCVEINFRMTMGMAAILQYEIQTQSPQNINVEGL